MATLSGPKDIILVIDVSRSMNNYGHMTMAKDAAVTVIETLTITDRVAIMAFSDMVSVIGDNTMLIRATNKNKEKFKEAIMDLIQNGATNFCCSK